MDTKNRSDIANTILMNRLKSLVGNRGIELYKSLGFNVMLDGNDIERPILFIPMYCASMIERDKYGKAIQQWYNNTYGRNIKCFLTETF